MISGVVSHVSCDEIIDFEEDSRSIEAEYCFRLVRETTNGGFNATVLGLGGFSGPLRGGFVGGRELDARDAEICLNDHEVYISPILPKSSGHWARSTSKWKSKRPCSKCQPRTSQPAPLPLCVSTLVDVQACWVQVPGRHRDR